MTERVPEPGCGVECTEWYEDQDWWWWQEGPTMPSAKWFKATCSQTWHRDPCVVVRCGRRAGHAGLCAWHPSPEELVAWAPAYSATHYAYPDGICADQSLRGWVCTEQAAHRGPHIARSGEASRKGSKSGHIARSGERLCAVWPPEPTITDQSLEDALTTLRAL